MAARAPTKLLASFWEPQCFFLVCMTSMRMHLSGDLCLMLQAGHSQTVVQSCCSLSLNVTEQTIIASTLQRSGEFVAGVAGLQAAPKRGFSVSFSH